MANVKNEVFASGYTSEQLIKQVNDDSRGYVRKIESLTADGTYAVPAGYRLESIVINNKTANAITGGLKIGTTAGGVDVVAAQAVAANAFLDVADSAILKRVFSTIAVQTLYLRAVTAWNNANIDVYIRLSKLA